jgi:uncharacterized membrane protein YbhN (UPF0104 family)
VESLQAFLDAARLFLDNVTQVQLQPLGIALLLHTGNLVLRTRAWFRILRAAYPGTPFRWRGVLGAYLSGVGINAFAPARAGDVVKVYAVRQRIPDSTTPTIVSSLLAETLIDMPIALALMTWAYTTGRLPTLPDIPSAPAFEWSFFARHQRATEIGLVVLLFVVAVGIRWLAHHVRAFWQRVKQGLTIVRTPGRYLRQVGVPQGLGWCCRLGTAYFLLEAFNVEASIENAALVLVVGSISTLLPFTPGGAGAQQALLVIVLAGAASTSTLLAYSVGAQVVTLVLNVLLGGAAMLLLFRGLHWREIVRTETARTEAAQAQVPPA